MRTKALIPGFKNSQKFRIMLRKNGVEVGLYLTLRQICVETFATTGAGGAAVEAVYYLAQLRALEKSCGGLVPIGFVRNCNGFEVQLDMI